MPRRRSSTLTEHDIQAHVITWARFVSSRHPELQLLFAIPNGGWRGPITGAKMKAEGVLPGVPDLCLPVARGGWFGLYIEMKTATGRPSTVQRAILDRLAQEGYLVAVCHSYAAAIDLLTRYIAFNPTKPKVQPDVPSDNT